MSVVLIHPEKYLVAKDLHAKPISKRELESWIFVLPNMYYILILQSSYLLPFKKQIYDIQSHGRMFQGHGGTKKWLYPVSLPFPLYSIDNNSFSQKQKVQMHQKPHSYVRFLFRIVGNMEINPIRNSTTSVFMSYRSLTDFKSPRASPACRYIAVKWSWVHIIF